MNDQSTSANFPAELAHKLWDEIFKSIIRRMPEQLFPLFKHIFGKGYPRDTPVQPLSAEYPVPGRSDPGQLSSIFADNVLRIAGTDIYHLECQIKKENRISIRMFEYDVNISLLYGACNSDGMQELQFPISMILYLGTNGTVPDNECCRVIMADENEVSYRIPVVKVQNYSLQEIKENHLTILLPYTLLRFRPRLKAKKKKITKNELTIFVKEIILILKYEFFENNITQWQYNDYISYICMAVEQVFNHYPKLYKEALEMMYDEFFLEIDINRLLSKRLKKRWTNELRPKILEEVKDQVAQEVRAQVTDEVTAEVTAKVTDEVTAEVTAKVTDEVTAKVTNEVTAQVIGEWSQKLADAHYENARLRALLRANGIGEESPTLS